jgi:hypothetical protein
MRRPTAIPIRSASSALAAASACLIGAGAAHGATLAICRTVDISGAATPALTVPAGSLFRDNGRADDPLAAFTRDYWALRLETIGATTIAPLSQCATTQVRITSDSSVKSVGVADNRRFVYAGSANLLDIDAPSEELLGVIGVVLDQVP